MAASTVLRSTFEEAGHVLRDDPGSVVMERPTDEQRRNGRFVTVLAVPVGAEGGALQHEIELHAGTTRRSSGRVALPVRWQAIGHEHRYPTFEGELVVMASTSGEATLALFGAYEVPFGPAGWVGDRVGGHHFAQRSLATFVEHAAGRLDAEVDRRSSAPSPADSSYVIDLREVGSENYLG
jgi:hypothetical protein